MRFTKPHTHRQAFKSRTPGVDVPLTPDEVAELTQALARTRERMGPFYLGHQYLGRQATIGCVALEITQRCNLDCSLCYLSENSAQVKDLPLQELLRRLEQIRRHFGIGTVVQITGGDPTLRDRRELVAIVRRARELGLPPALLTNGIQASRALLIELAEAGLNDVAFHVDLTQKRKGFTSETALNALRAEYLERGRGLPINVMFNTTVYDGNFAEIPEVVQFFIHHADVVSMASFQLQADTGRGVLRNRHSAISLESVREHINRGAGRALPWDAVLVGHPQCHNYVLTFVVNGQLYPVIPDQHFYSHYLRDFSEVIIDRRASKRAVIWHYLKAARRKPHWYWRGLGYGLRQLWCMKQDLLAARGTVHKLSFFIHNFMDAEALDPARIHACSFMVMTADGPMSMCAHNARRDEFILKPLEIETEHGKTWWLPLRAEKKPHPSTAAAQGQTSGICGGCGP
jgi:7,8-dihydro-6-hydroxymethylpterin dimethyltransferase